MFNTGDCQLKLSTAVWYKPLWGRSGTNWKYIKTMTVAMSLLLLRLNVDWTDVLCCSVVFDNSSNNPQRIERWVVPRLVTGVAPGVHSESFRAIRHTRRALPRVESNRQFVPFIRVVDVTSSSSVRLYTRWRRP